MATKIERSRPGATRRRRRTTAKLASAAAGALDVAGIREGLGLTRAKFARLGGFSERGVANWEAGEPLSAPTRQRMVELDRLRAALAEVVDPAHLGNWLDRPNPAFDGLKPIEVVERGEADRLWRMIYHLGAGEPS